MKTIILMSILAFGPGNLFAQSKSIQSLFEKVEECQKNRLAHSRTEKRDAVFADFDSAIQELFNHPEFCKAAPGISHPYFLYNAQNGEESGEYLAYAFMGKIVIVSSLDEKIRVFSWDDLGGGTAHFYTNYVQYQGLRNTCEVVPIDTAENSIQVGYYQIHKVNDPNRDLYLLFGYGTYGGGTHHYVVKVLEIKLGQLVECFDCYPDGKGLLIGAHRSMEVDLDFDQKNQILSFQQFKFDDDAGFYTHESEFTSLKFTNGRLTKK